MAAKRFTVYVVQSLGVWIIILAGLHFLDLISPINILAIAPNWPLSNREIACDQTFPVIEQIGPTRSLGARAHFDQKWNNIGSCRVTRSLMENIAVERANCTAANSQISIEQLTQ